jgi:hypothetical protein
MLSEKHTASIFRAKEDFRMEGAFYFDSLCALFQIFNVCLTVHGAKGVCISGSELTFNSNNSDLVFIVFRATCWYIPETGVLM